MVWQIGESIGAYELREQVGQGGMATVYKAYHASLDRFVAVKVIHANFLDDDSFIARFAREAQIVARLAHPHIVPVYDYDEYQKRPFLVMKYLEGETLKERLARGVLPIEEIMHLMGGIAAALDYAHQNDVLHRDIKPSNIFIGHNQYPYLTDFGLARMIQAGQSTLSADMLLGTPHYISPEQAKGQKDLDGRTDVYSFGVVLYELFVGRVPFTADSHYAIVHDHINTPVPAPTLVNSEITNEVTEVLLKAIEKKPSQRQSTVTELMQELQRAIDKTSLKTLDEERASIAEISLAQFKLQAQNASQNATPLLKAPYKTATLYQTASIPNASSRAWVVGGFSTFLATFFIGFFVLLGATDNLVQLGQLIARNQDLAQRSVFSNIALTKELIDVGVAIEPQNGIPVFIIPTVSVAQAQSILNSTEDPIANLLLAKSYWAVGEPKNAYETISEGENNSILTFYLISAANLAKEMEDYKAETSYLLYAATNESRTLIPLVDVFAPNLGQSLYDVAIHVDTEILGDNLVDVLESSSGANVSDILENPSTLWLLVRINILNNNLAEASDLIEKISGITPIVNEKNLLLAELTLAEGNIEQAITQLETIEQSSASDWIKNRAEQLLEEIEDSQ